jgi:hypothetical protein
LQKVLSIELSLSELFYPIRALLDFLYDITDVGLVFPNKASARLAAGYSQNNAG